MSDLTNYQLTAFVDHYITTGGIITDEKYVNKAQSEISHNYTLTSGVSMLVLDVISKLKPEWLDMYMVLFLNSKNQEEKDRKVQSDIITYWELAAFAVHYAQTNGKISNPAYITRVKLDMKSSGLLSIVSGIDDLKNRPYVISQDMLSGVSIQLDPRYANIYNALKAADAERQREVQKKYEKTLSYKVKKNIKHILSLRLHVHSKDDYDNDED